MGKVRSPNYPAISLKEATPLVRKLYSKEHRNKMSREAVAEILGYTGLNGASIPTISALSKYGLLEGRGSEIRVSDTAVSILVEKEGSAEWQAALKTAVTSPSIFKDLAKQFEGLPTPENARIFLQKKGFTEDAAKKAARNYLDSMGLVIGTDGDYTEAVDDPEASSASDKAKKEERQGEPKPSPQTPPLGAGGPLVMPPQVETKDPQKPPPGVFQMTLEGNNTLEVKLAHKLTPEEFAELFNENLFPFLRMSLVHGSKAGKAGNGSPE